MLLLRSPLVIHQSRDDARDGGLSARREQLLDPRGQRQDPRPTTPPRRPGQRGASRWRRLFPSGRWLGRPLGGCGGGGQRRHLAEIGEGTEVDARLSERRLVLLHLGLRHGAWVEMHQQKEAQPILRRAARLSGGRSGEGVGSVALSSRERARPSMTASSMAK